MKALGRTVAEAALAPTREGNDLTFHVDGGEVYPEIRRLVRAAEKTIDVAFFSFHDDPSGLDMADELAAAARKGVRVNIMPDHLGARHSTEVIARMTQAGVNVQTFKNSPNMHPKSITDHHKIVLVDGKEGITDGLNIGERDEAYWHDVMVTVKGPVGTSSMPMRSAAGSALPRRPSSAGRPTSSGPPSRASARCFQNFRRSRIAATHATRPDRHGRASSLPSPG